MSFERNVLCLNGGGYIGHVYETEQGDYGYFVHLQGFGGEGYDTVEEAQAAVREEHEECLQQTRSDFYNALISLRKYDPASISEIIDEVGYNCQGSDEASIGVQVEAAFRAGYRMAEDADLDVDLALERWAEVTPDLYRHLNDSG